MTHHAAALFTALRALDDDALAALANKGLVRRARKDLESCPPPQVEEGDAGLVVAIDGFRVTVGENPAAAVCTCPAAGVCRHVLAALIFLRDSPPEGFGEPAENQTAAKEISPDEEILAINDEILRKWAGKALLRKAAQSLAAGMMAEIDTGPSLAVRFPQRNVTCRWIPGGGLEGMICSCHADRPCEHRVAAVLAVQAKQGKRSLAAEEAVTEASAGAPRTREEVRESVGEVLREMVSLGLSRLSPATRERLQTLAVSAHGVDLPRMERLLQSLADDVGAILNRSARASSSLLLATAARTEALRTALARPTAALVGRHRSRYDQIGDIYLQGVGARQWRTRSGYVGLTVYFWDESASNWATWTDARPADVEMFDPAARYRGPGPWEGCPSPESAARCRIRATGVWRNPVGRLSGRASTTAIIEQETDWLGIPRLMRDWGEVTRQAVRYFGGGLHERTEQDEIVLLAPQNWERPTFDPIHQELTVTVYDQRGRPLPLALSYREETGDAIEMLESHDLSKVRAVFGLLRHVQGRLSVEPVTLIEDASVTNLTLDAARSAKVRKHAHSGDPPPELGLDAADEEQQAIAESGTKVGRILFSAMSELEAIAESGVAAGHDWKPLRDAAAQLKQMGLNSAADSLTRFLADLERARKTLDAQHRGRAAESLLRTYYVFRLAAEHDALAAVAS